MSLTYTCTSNPSPHTQTNVGHLSEQKDVLMQQVSEADTTNQFLRSRLDESERMAMHSQALHDQVSHRDVEIQALNIRLQVRAPSDALLYCTVYYYYSGGNLLGSKIYSISSRSFVLLRLRRVRWILINLTRAF